MFTIVGPVSLSQFQTRDDFRESARPTIRSVRIFLPHALAVIYDSYDDDYDDDDDGPTTTLNKPAEEECRTPTDI